MSSKSLFCLRVAYGAVARRAGGESLAVDVYDQMRSDIFDQLYAPGARLLPVELCRRFGVSLGVMREALGLLAAQNLVQIARNRGFSVTTLSPAALADLTEARKVNEGAALRLSVQCGGVQWESEVLAAHHRLAAQPVYLPGPPVRGNRAWSQAHSAFHHSLIAGCGNVILLDICDRLSDAAELYRAWSGPPGVILEEGRDIAREHRELMEAALDHDAVQAVGLFEAHVERTAEILLELEARRGQLPTTPEEQAS